MKIQERNGKILNQKEDEVQCDGTHHSWDKVKGVKISGKPWVGIKSKTVRTCTICGKKEYWTNDGLFCGWFDTP